MKIKVVVDRIEEDMAVLLVGEEEISVDFPLSCLPNAREGAIFEFSVREDNETEQERRQKAEELLRKLLNKEK